jgi:hypothetical protein
MWAPARGRLPVSVLRNREKRFIDSGIKDNQEASFHWEARLKGRGYSLSTASHALPKASGRATPIDSCEFGNGNWGKVSGFQYSWEKLEQEMGTRQGMWFLLGVCSELAY